jgi:hypothetical protein
MIALLFLIDRNLFFNKLTLPKREWRVNTGGRPEEKVPRLYSAGLTGLLEVYGMDRVMIDQAGFIRLDLQ